MLAQQHTLAAQQRREAIDGATRMRRAGQPQQPPEALALALQSQWASLAVEQRFVYFKLITGAFRVGVSKLQVRQFGQGGFKPGAAGGGIGPALASQEGAALLERALGPLRVVKGLAADTGRIAPLLALAGEPQAAFAEHRQQRRPQRHRAPAEFERLR
ncbi:hypothetical protein FUT87_11035 [Mitsuaria sp. TWR114]|nr:hypothetical protein FUT87_11035 [Mitsuaria sp. TWR114]